MCVCFFSTSLLIIFILLALSYLMLRDFINIYELFLVFLDEGKHINTTSIYSPAISSACKLELLCLITLMVLATNSFIKILNSAFFHVVPQVKQVSFIYQGPIQMTRVCFINLCESLVVIYIDYIMRNSIPSTTCSFSCRATPVEMLTHIWFHKSVLSDPLERYFM